MKASLVFLACLWVLMGCATSTSRLIYQPKTQSAVMSKAVPVGPTVYLKGDSGELPVNPISSLMYFVQLISPEPVKMSESLGNTQQSRILSVKQVEESGKFKATCQFEIIGKGTQNNIFDQTVAIRANEELLTKGGTLKRRLSFINIHGSGQGDILVEGVMSGDLAIADKITMRFNVRGHSTPVTIGINGIRMIKGKPHAINDTVIQVNSLVFRRQEGRPKMNVSVDSIKSGDAGSGLLSNLVGKVKGSVANMFIPPVPIRAKGNNAMLDFAQAIVDGKKQFTFPAAK